MFGSIKKLPTRCPHCGFVQNEPAGLISTYCRGCGDHYSVAAREAQPSPAKLNQFALGAIVRKKLLAHPPRRIICHECNRENEVHPPDARSTVCRACGTTIRLDNVEILGHCTRVVQTRGDIHVRRNGFLNATRVACGNAFVEGRIAGKVICENTLRFRGSGLCRAQITARRLIVDRGAVLRCPSTLHVGEIVIRGEIEADIECAGTLHIGRHGSLEGNIQSRAMVVDKGGSYSGDVQVMTCIRRPDPESEPHGKSLPPGAAVWRPGLAFG